MKATLSAVVNRRHPLGILGGQFRCRNILQTPGRVACAVAKDFYLLIQTQMPAAQLKCLNSLFRSCKNWQVSLFFFFLNHDIYIRTSANYHIHKHSFKSLMCFVSIFFLKTARGYTKSLLKLRICPNHVQMVDP